MKRSFRGFLYDIGREVIKMNKELLRKIKRFCRNIITASISRILTRPVSRRFGFDRGLPIDRAYIEDFLEKHRDVITGNVLEIAANDYTLKFAHEPFSSHVLHVMSGNPNATLVGNLETGENIPADYFDCMVITQTLAFVFDMHGFLRNCHRALKPGGVLLLTNPSISPVSRYDMDRWGDYWRFTDLSMKKLLELYFPPEKIEVVSYGNYYAAAAYLSGKAVEEIRRSRLFPADPDYPVNICAAARK